jgi:hypothetical protein
MSDENFPPVQISIFLGPEKFTAPQLVLRGNTIADVAGQLRVLTDIDPVDEVSPISGILENLGTIKAAADVFFGVQATPKARSGDGFTPATVPDDPWAGTDAQPEKRCKHGVMKYKEGVSAAGKPYKGYMCPSFNRQDQCPPEWVR